ncbi:response regulator transcription factor [Streptomyces sp. NPDC059850]|uniref:response regulator transcription factor n=1 Tax=Streptomyces sp. NPDC059850 TaxID=3346970 RepID=UPI003666A2C0
MANISRREREAIQLLAGGATPTEAAAEMAVHPSTVNAFLRNASAKLHAVTRPGLVHKAYRLGVITPSEPADRLPIEHILRGMATGHDFPWIAANSGVRVDTMRDDVSALMRLMGAKTHEHLIRRGWELDLLGPAQDAKSRTGN